MRRIRLVGCQQQLLQHFQFVHDLKQLYLQLYIFNFIEMEQWYISSIWWNSPFLLIFHRAINFNFIQFSVFLQCTRFWKINNFTNLVNIYTSIIQTSPYTGEKEKLETKPDTWASIFFLDNEELMILFLSITRICCWSDIRFVRHTHQLWACSSQ